ncbi:MAG: archaetidylserine decarboxylase [Planctomycetota bacterium]
MTAPQDHAGSSSLHARGQIALSHCIGWLADRWVPPFLRNPLFRTYGALTGANLDEMRGAPRDHASLGAFFVRRLRDGARPFEADPSVLPSPVDALVQASSPIERGQVVEAKGRTYALRELLAGVGADVELEGGHQVTLYLGPKDYHRIHSPLDALLVEARHVPGRRWSVQPRVLAARKVLAVNERVVLRLEADGRTFFMVLVGALIVGRIRVVGLERFPDGPLPEPRRFARGAELGRFEMGSTVVLVTPPGALVAGSAPAEGAAVKLGAPLAGWQPATPTP